MNRIASLGATGIVMFVWVACGPTEATMPQTVATLPLATATTTPVSTPVPSAIPSTFFLFSEPGPYQVDTRHNIQFTDTERDGREVAIDVWFPSRDDKPAFSGAPYPLILSSAKVANIFASHLASHGYVVAGIKRADFYDPWDQNLIDQPLDILFALNQIASSPPEGLEGMIDAEHAGVMGYSFDGYNALALSGARVDQENYLAQCANVTALQPALSEWRIRYYCTIAGEWDKFASHAGQAITTGSDGLWQPMTDKRIRAVMPMAPEGAWLFGERGLAAVNRPTLIIGATDDHECPYYSEAAYIFEHLGTPDRFLISFVNQGHMMVYDTKQVARMKHFSVAFFGYYLQGRQDYDIYFSEDFVSQHDQLAWGVYTE